MLQPDPELIPQPQGIWRQQVHTRRHADDQTRRRVLHRHHRAPPVTDMEPSAWSLARIQRESRPLFSIDETLRMATQDLELPRLHYLEGLNLRGRRSSISRHRRQ